MKSKEGFKVTLPDGAHNSRYSPIQSATLPILRGYQREAVAAVQSELAAKDSTLLVMPTGTGKTVTFCQVIAEVFPKKSVLVLAHRMELLEQARRTLWRFGVSDEDIAVVGGEYGANAPCNSRKGIVLASKDSMQGKRLAAWDREFFGLVVVDESHHSTASTYKAIASHFYGAKRLGVTATPDRLDGVGLGEVFESVAYCYEIRDAIESEYLVPLRQIYIDVDGIDLERIKTVAGDFSGTELDAMLSQEDLLHRMVLPTIQEAQERSTVIFATSIAHAEKIEEIGNRYRPGRFLSISGRDSATERARKLGKFSSGEVQFLVNRDLLTEGVDIPRIACVAMYRPTKSRGFYMQAIGRGMRLLGATYAESIAAGKSDCLVLDFVGNSRVHGVVSAVDCLDGRKSEDIKRRVESIIRGDKQLSLMQALERAEKAIGEEKQRAARYDKARYRKEEIDPFTVLSIAPQKGRYGGVIMTEKQRHFLERSGIDSAAISAMDKGQAIAAINELVRRRKGGLATYKQSKLLLKYGCNPNLSAHDASQVIGEIARSGWRVAGDIIALSEQLAIGMESETEEETTGG